MLIFRMNKKVFFSLFLVFTIGFSACKKKEQLISVDILSDMSYYQTFITFSYENINPIFPKVFNKDDFFETE